MLFLTVFVSSRELISLILVPLTAYVSYAFLFLFFGASIYGTIVSFGSFSVEFVEACAALGAYILMGMLVLLTKDIGFKRGLKVFVIGSLLILIANVLRILLMAFVLKNFSVNLFATLHYFIWNFVSGVYVALVWVGLVYKFKVKNIPIYSDLKFLWKNSIFH